MEARSSALNYGFLKTAFQDTNLEHLDFDNAKTPKELLKSVWKASQESAKTRSVRIDKSLKLCEEFLKTLLTVKPSKKNKQQLESLLEETCTFLEKKVEKQEFRGDTRSLEKVFSKYHKEHPPQVQEKQQHTSFQTRPGRLHPNEAASYFKNPKDERTNMQTLKFEGSIDDFWEFFETLRPALEDPAENHMKTLTMELSLNSERPDDEGKVFLISLKKFVDILSKVPFKRETSAELFKLTNGIAETKKLLAQSRKRPRPEAVKKEPPKKQARKEEPRPASPPRTFVGAPQGVQKEISTSYLNLRDKEKPQEKQKTPPQSPQYNFPEVPQEPPRRRPYSNLHMLQQTAKKPENYTFDKIEGPRGQTFHKTIAVKTRPFIEAIFKNEKVKEASRQIEDILHTYWEPKGNREQYASYIADQIRNTIKENFLDDEQAKANFMEQLQKINKTLKDATLHKACKILAEAK